MCFFMPHALLIRAVGQQPIPQLLRLICSTGIKLIDGLRCIEMPVYDLPSRRKALSDAAD